jgi:hypothetical protein
LEEAAGFLGEATVHIHTTQNVLTIERLGEVVVHASLESGFQVTSGAMLHVSNHIERQENRTGDHTPQQQ